MSYYLRDFFRKWLKGSRAIQKHIECHGYRFYSGNTWVAYIENKTIFINSKQYKSRVIQKHIAAVKEFANEINYEIKEIEF